MKKTILLFLVFVTFVNFLNAQGHYTDGPYGKAITCFTFNGTDIFAGTSDGGVFLSSDNGLTWKTVSTGLISTDILSLAISGTNIFAGTKGAGIFLSTNNGTSWNAVNNDILSSAWIYSLLVKEANIFAGTGKGIYLSKNNGLSWDAVNKGIPSSTIVNSLIASGSNIFAGTTNGVYLSNNNGTSWTAVNNGLTRIDTIDYDGSSFTHKTTTEIKSLAAIGTNIFAGTLNEGVLLSTNNGTSWTSVNSGLKGIWVSSLAVSGTNIYASIFSKGLFKSDDNGKHWTAVNTIVNIENPWFRSLAVNGTNIYAGFINTVFVITPTIPDIKPTFIDQIKVGQKLPHQINCGGYTEESTKNPNCRMFSIKYDVNSRDIGNGGAVLGEVIGIHHNKNDTVIGVIKIMLRLNNEDAQKVYNSRLSEYMRTQSNNKDLQLIKVRDTNNGEVDGIYYFIYSFDGGKKYRAIGVIEKAIIEETYMPNSSYDPKLKN